MVQYIMPRGNDSFLCPCRDFQTKRSVENARHGRTQDRLMREYAPVAAPDFIVWRVCSLQKRFKSAYCEESS